MPELWSSLLTHSKITKQEQKQNPQAVIDALDFYQHAAHKRESKFMYSSCKNLTPPISADLADKFRQTVVLVSDRSTSVKLKKPSSISFKLFCFSHKNEYQMEF
jgi:hypothetical protein